jgi:hypothetical protein
MRQSGLAFMVRPAGLALPDSASLRRPCTPTRRRGSSVPQPSSSLSACSPPDSRRRQRSLTPTSRRPTSTTAPRVVVAGHRGVGRAGAAGEARAASWESPDIAAFHYRPELPSSTRSHIGEDLSDVFLG